MYHISNAKVRAGAYVCSTILLWFTGYLFEWDHWSFLCTVFWDEVKLVKLMIHKNTKIWRRASRGHLSFRYSRTYLRGEQEYLTFHPKMLWHSGMRCLHGGRWEGSSVQAPAVGIAPTSAALSLTVHDCQGELPFSPSQLQHLFPGLRIEWQQSLVTRHHPEYNTCKQPLEQLLQVIGPESNTYIIGDIDRLKMLNYFPSSIKLEVDFVLLQVGHVQIAMYSIHANRRIVEFLTAVTTGYKQVQRF